jgi:hypothetical protein
VNIHRDLKRHINDLFHEWLVEKFDIITYDSEETDSEQLTSDEGENDRT